MIDQQLGDDPRHELAGIVPFASFEAQREHRRWQEMCGRRLRFRRRGATLRRMRPYPFQPVTLAELRQCGCRVWLYCDSCGRGAPAAVAPRIIRLSPAASSGVVRRGARCTLCGGRGASLRLPSWGGLDVGIAPFPADRFAKRLSAPLAAAGVAHVE
jgi:hypothetical protein